MLCGQTIRMQTIFFTGSDCFTECCTHDLNMNAPEWAFRALTRAHHMAHAAVFDSLGLKDIGQPLILAVLSDDNVSRSQKELGDILNVSAPTVTMSIKSLEKRGCVKKTSDENDMRRNLIELTPLGREIAGKCRCAFDSIDQAMYSGFSEQERELAAKLFRRAADNLLALAGEGRNEA